METVRAHTIPDLASVVQEYYSNLIYNDVIKQYKDCLTRIPTRWNELRDDSWEGGDRFGMRFDDPYLSVCCGRGKMMFRVFFTDECHCRGTGGPTQPMYSPSKFIQAQPPVPSGG